MTDHRSICRILSDLFASYDREVSEMRLEAYAKRLDKYPLEAIQWACRNWDNLDRPPTAHRLVQLCERYRKVPAEDPAVIALRQHTLSQTIPNPRPYGYPSDAHLARRGPESIRIYNAMARGAIETANRISVAEMAADGTLDALPQLSETETAAALAKMEEMGIHPPAGINLDLCARSFMLGYQR